MLHLNPRLLPLMTILLLVPTATACGDDSPGEGTVTVQIWGEQLIEEGIPAADLADGWQVRFDHFVVTVDGITAAGQTFPAAQSFDLTGPGPFAVATGPVTAGAIEPVAYSLVPAAGDTANVNVDPALFDEMVAEGWSVYVSGSATRDGSTITFTWGFDVAVTYTGCHATGTVPTNDSATTQLTIHGDHLFYESLVDHDAALRFDALADADTDGDHDVTPAELAALSGIPFQALDHYDVPAGSNIDNLWDYLSAQIRTLGHIDGEGHCDF